MPFDWSTVEADITEVITEYGGEAILRPPSGDDIPVLVVIANYDQAERDSELILYADRKVYLSTVGVTEEPTTSHRLVFEGSSLRIVSVDIIKPKPGGPVLCYVLQVRS